MNFWFGLDRLFFLLARLFVKWCTRAGALLEDGEVPQLDAQVPVFYILRESSVADLAVADREARRLGLPSPMQALHLGDASLRRSYLFLFRRKLFGGRQHVARDDRSLQQLAEAVLAHPQADVQLVPVSLFWGRRPDKENSFWRILLADNWSAPGRIKKFFMILAQGRQLFVQFGQPLSLRALAEDQPSPQRLTRKAQRILRVHFRRQREAVIGPDLSHRRTLVASLVDSVPVREAIAQASVESGEPLERMEEKARAYAMEIAADYSHTVIRFLELVLDWVWNRVYSGLRIYHLNKLAQVAREHEIVYVPCHRSHADYLLLSFLLYRNGFVPPHIAAGINLNLPVVGTILRRGGAFFMRRSFRDNPLYATVFNEYLHIILSRGYSIEYFVEGGRSRSGRMLSPRPGMLKMTVESVVRGTQKPVALVPVYIGYERLIEGQTYLGELQGQAKKKESIFGLMKSLSILRSQFGQVHVNFGDPIRLDQFLDQTAPDWRQTDLSAPLPAPLRDGIQTLGLEVVSRINAAAVANPINLLSLALLATRKHTMDEQLLRRQLDLYLTLLQQAPFSDCTAIAETDAGAIIEYGLRNDFVSRIDHPMGSLIHADAVTALQMTYVRNNTLHLFALPGLICALLKDARAIHESHFHRLLGLLYPFVRDEYFLPWEPDTRLRPATEHILTVLQEQGLVVREDQFLRGAPLHTLEADLLTHLGQTVSPVLERYYITIRLLVQVGPGVLLPEQLEELAQHTAQRLSLLHEFAGPEFFDRTVLRTFIQALQTHGLVQRNEDGTLAYQESLQTLDEEARRILNPTLRQAIMGLTRQSAGVVLLPPARQETTPT